jgi:pyruvate kinase
MEAASFSKNLVLSIKLHDVMFQKTVMLTDGQIHCKVWAVTPRDFNARVEREHVKAILVIYALIHRVEVSIIRNKTKL